MITTLDQLKQFCSTDETRPQIREPFSLGNHTYFTDGRIILRVARMKGIPENEKAPGGSASRFEYPTSKEGDLDLIPEIPADKFEACVMCGGMGWFQGDKACKKEAKNAVACEDCDGGRTLVAVPIQVGSRWVANHYLRKIASLPGFALVDRLGEADSPLPFRFNDGVGLLMPMRVDLKIHRLKR